MNKCLYNPHPVLKKVAIELDSPIIKGLHQNVLLLQINATENETLAVTPKVSIAMEQLCCKY